MTALKTLLRRAKSLLWTAFSILIVLAAVLMGIANLLMPYSDRYQPELEAWLSREFGQPVVLEGFEGEWTAFGPRLSLRGMKLLPANAAAAAAAEVMIESAALDIRPLNALLPGFPLYSFRVIGADFDLVRSEDGQFRLSGFGVSRRAGGGEGSALADLARVGEVVLEESSLNYRDEKLGIELGFSGIGGRLKLKNKQLAAEVHARLFDDRSALVFGDVEATVLLSQGRNGRFDRAQWQVTARELMLAALQSHVPPNPFLPLTGWFNTELWGEWSKAEGHRVSGVADLKQARLVSEFKDRWLEHVNTRFQWRFSGKRRWALHLADLLYDDGEQSWTTPRLSMARDTTRDLGLWISADHLPLDVPLHLARDVMSIYGTPWPAFLPGAASGEVSELDLVLNARWRPKTARGELRQASVSDWDRWPDLEGLDGSVRLGSGSGRLQLRGDSVQVTWPRMFRDTLGLALPACTVDFRWGEAWQVGLGDCAIENEDLSALGDLVISANSGKPAVDANVAVTRGDAGRLDPYWPENVMSDATKAWLRHGLKGGRILGGRVQIHGDMDDWPFRHGEGRFEAVVQVADGQIDYLAGWPAAHGVEAVARFVGAGMDIEGQTGDIGGVRAHRVHAVIRDFKAPVLELDYAADSDLPGFLGFLQQTPLLGRSGVDLSRFVFAGPATTQGHISVPLGAAAGELEINGGVTLADNRFSDPDLGIVISGIEGRLGYDQMGFRGRDLRASYRDQSAGLKITADFDSDEMFRAELDGVLAPADVIPGFLSDRFTQLQQATGRCDWRAAVVVSAAVVGGNSRTVLQLDSDLEGVALDLPAPLAKSQAENWPLSLRLPLTGDDRVLDVDIGDRLKLRFDLPPGADSPRRAVIHLGAGPAELPGDGFLRVDGSAATTDLDGWVDLVIDEIEAGRGMGGLALEGSHFSTSELQFLDRRFANVELGIEVGASEVRGSFSSEDIDGSVRFTTGDDGMNSLSAEFERLALGDPVTSGMEMDTDPAALPALHLYARSFRYAGAELGETRIEAYPVTDGFHFEKVDAKSERLNVQASGTWSRNDDGQRSDFNIHMTSESLGDFLQSMGISSPVEGGQTLVEFNAWWPGSPGMFALSRLNGRVDFSVIDGNITEASTGTGRLLGLLSVQALPKRLALDFRDVFDTGFAFDEAAGTFTMENGTAYTDNVLLKSSAAQISVSGRTDLVAQEFDQLLTIRPGVGNTLPIIGALAAGPGGAAAGLALQGLLQDELAEATKVEYAVTGPWESPQFEAVEVERQGG